MGWKPASETHAIERVALTLLLKDVLPPKAQSSIQASIGQKASEIGVNEMMGEKSNGGSEQADDGEENRSPHPFRNFRMPKQFVRHYDKRREEEEAEIRSLGCYSQCDDKDHKTNTPKTIVRGPFKGVNNFGGLRFALMSRVVGCNIVLPQKK